MHHAGSGHWRSALGFLLIGLPLLFSGVYSLSRLLDMDNKTKTLQGEVARILQHLKG